MNKYQDIDYIKESIRSSSNQKLFVSFLQSKYPNNKYITEINVSIELEGDLDLGILDSLYPSVEYIYFVKKGKITGLINIPSKIKHLICNGQYLTNIPNLPESLEILNVSHNNLSKLDLFRCSNLVKLNCEFNRITYISGLPSTLKTLICHHNRIGYLDLISAAQLETFIYHNNKSIILKNVPSTIRTGYNHDTHALLDHHEPIENVSEDYTTKLNSYFYVKKLYNNGKQSKTECQGCKKNVGMVFSSKNRKYSAYCGGNPPCSFKMEISRGFYHPFQDLLDSYQETVDEIKQSIIQHKMDVLFNYMDEKKASELHKEEMEAFQSAKQFLDEKQELYNEYFFSTEKKEKMEEHLRNVNEKLIEVKQAIENDELNEAVEIEHNEIHPLMQQISALEYEINEVEIKLNRNKELTSLRLYQEPVHFSKMELKLSD